MKRVITIEPYEVRVLILAGEETQKKELPKYGEEWSPEWCGLVIEAEDQPFELICCLPKRRDEFTLWHEALHLTTRVLESRGVPTDVTGDEVVAYTQEHIVRLIDKALYKRPRRT